jgi:hypothetical protein
MKIQYKSHIFRKEALAIIEAANSIISEYQAQGYHLTLCQSV